MSTYTPQQISEFIRQRGIGGDPFAIANFARQYGVTPAAVDAALGAAPGQSQAWLDANSPQRFAAMGSQSQADLQRAIGGGVSYSGNPHQAYQYAQSRGWTPEQADRAFQFDPGTSAGWANGQGLQWGANGIGGSPAMPPSMPTAGNPPQAQASYQPNPSASPWQPMAGGWSGQQGGMPAWQQQSFLSRFGTNPATDWMAGAIGQRLGQNLQRNLLPGIRGNAFAAGGVGGSRQGVAEGIAIGDTMTGYGNALANLYSGQYNQDRNYGLQSDQLDYSIWQGNNALQRQAQQDQLGLADRMLGWNQQGLNFATQAQNTPLNYWQQFGNQATQFAGLGGTQSQNMQGNPWLSGLGGAMTGANLWNQWNNPGNGRS